MEPAKFAVADLLDPLLYCVDLPLRQTYYPNGFLVTISTNSREVLDAAAESWDGFQQRFSEPSIEVRVAVGAVETNGLPEAPVFLGQDHLVAIVADARNFAVCDYERRFAWAWLSPRVVRDRDWLRFHFLEAVVYMMLAQLYLTPLHAACVERRGSGVLLCGGPGAGKSSMAFACAQRGWTYVADDASSLVRNHGDRLVLGRPGQIRFREDAEDLFPELAGRLAKRRANAKMTIEVRTTDLEGISTAFEAQADYVVFLKRPSSGSARLTTVSRDEAQERILQGIPLLGQSVREEQEASLRRLLGAEAFELHYTDLESATDCLDRLVESRG